jgi:uncharacterized metal-binding protein YceD (DUF177 family)
MLKTYRVDLKKLSPATNYTFDYVLDSGFFEGVEGPEVEKGKVNVLLTVVRDLSTFELDFRLEGVITVTCDRCLEEMEIPIETKNRLFVTLGETNTETTDERIVVSEEKGFIDIAWYMYEFVALAIPMKHVHEPGYCNEVMAARLREICVEELKEEDESSESENCSRKTDPRWDKLRTLMEDN